MLFKTNNLCFCYYKNPLIIKDVFIGFDNNSKNLCLASKQMGKTTLLQVLSTFENNYFGNIFLNGKDLKIISDKDKNFSLLLSTPVFFDSKSIKENFEYFFNVQNLKEDFASFEKLLNEFDLKIDLNKKIKTLSIFEKRVLAIVRSLIKSPLIFFLDDQFENLDDIDFLKMQNVYKKLLSRKNLTIFYALGDETYKRIDKSILFCEKVFYLAYANIRKYNNLDEFETKKDNIDAFNFLDGYISKKCLLICENKKYYLEFDEKGRVVLSEKLSKKLDKFAEKIINFEDCYLIFKQNFDENNINNLLGIGEMNLYSALSGNKLL